MTQQLCCKVRVDPYFYGPKYRSSDALPAPEIFYLFVLPSLKKINLKKNHTTRDENQYIFAMSECLLYQKYYRIRINFGTLPILFRSCLYHANSRFRLFKAPISANIPIQCLWNFMENFPCISFQLVLSFCYIFLKFSFKFLTFFFTTLL